MAQRDDAIAMRSQRMSVRAIGATLGVPRATVGDWTRGMRSAPSYVIHCPVCDADRTVKRKHARTCSDTCRSRLAWARWRVRQSLPPRAGELAMLARAEREPF